MRHLVVFCLVLVGLAGCEPSAINSPYSEQADEQTVLYSSFSLRPKHLDPARSYSSNEVQFTGQIYEPPLQYHYLNRPYSLIPLTAVQLPEVRYLDGQDNELPNNAVADSIAYSIYEINIKPGINFQPHPAFVRQENGAFQYHALNKADLAKINTLADFELTASRELTAADYIYQIKRLAHPEIHSPILSLMAEHIVGLKQFAEKLQQQNKITDEIDLTLFDIDGVKLIDRYRYQIKVKGKYPQLNYWLAMPFFAPMPWEADMFYQQQGLQDKNISLDWYPVGTGPYYLTKNDPNRQMVLERNPNFHGERYPSEGEAIDDSNGLLVDAGLAIPFIDKIVFSLEKENTSYWNKFLQGYYDVSGINSDSFDQAIQVASSGEFGLSASMADKNIELRTAIATSTSYIGFNMLDEVVGGYTEQAKKLRQAISIAIDYEEYISIFANGRGIAAQGPIPPGIFGHLDGQQGMNPYVYQWRNGAAQRLSLDYAKQLLTEAGYPDGRSQQTGEPLILNFDVPASGPDAKANFDWMRKQFQKLNIQLVIRNTDYNRFQEKMRQGQAQIFQWGWNADYPDPENFLFLLYGPNGKVSTSGENAANYNNEHFDALFEQMRVMDNSVARLQIIEQMMVILRQESPWVWGYHPKQFSLYHAWNKNVKPNLMANNTLKYRRVDNDQRQRSQQQWNSPVLWPLLMLAFVLMVLLLPAIFMYNKKKQLKVCFDE
ncbi:peptide ABC transporter substrate-binding protein [Methylophaga sp. 41_12_T18]|nr:peptide ABC transporter substrate-binding protein [Methylophaga sp. 41_12_T18]